MESAQAEHQTAHQTTSGTSREKSKITDWVVAGLTAVTAGAAIYSAWIFQGQLIEARHATVEARHATVEARHATVEVRRATEIQERPWLSVEPALVNGLSFVNGQQAAMNLKFSMKNVGHSVAKDVQLDIKMLPTSPGMPVATDALQHQRELCDHPKIQEIGTLDLFPVDQPAERQVSISATPSAGQLASIHVGDKTRSFVGFYVVGCVSYHSSFDNTLHQTRFAYHLIHAIPLENGKLFTLPDGMALMVGFEMGINVSKDGMTLAQELFALNDAN
jgi:hypothetical protein